MDQAAGTETRSASSVEPTEMITEFMNGLK